MSGYEAVETDRGSQSDDWSRLGLDESLPYLRAGTELGGVALKVVSDWAAFLDRWEAMEEASAKGRVDDWEFEELDETWLPGFMKHKLLHGFYGTIGGNLELLMSRGEKPVIYKGFIADARAGQLTMVETHPDCPESMRPVFRDFVNELSVLFWAESDDIARRCEAAGSIVAGLCLSEADVAN